MAELPAWILEQADPAELRSLTAVHDALTRMGPPFDVPVGLTPPVRRRWRIPWLAWLAVPAVAATVFALSLGPAPQRLRSTVGEPVDVTASVRVTPVGREVELHIERLRDPRPDGLYELWFVGPRGRVSAGTFHPDEDGRGFVRLLAAADPKQYPRLSVTLEPADGNPRRQGPEILY